MAQTVYTLKLVKHTGILVAWTNSKVIAQGDAERVRAAYRAVLRHNLLFGWWSPASFAFVNLYVLFQNRRARLKLEELIRANEGTVIA